MDSRSFATALFALALSAGQAVAIEDASWLAPPEPPAFAPSEVIDIPDAPLGLSTSGHQYSLLSGSGAGVKPIQVIHEADPNRSDARSRQKYAYIWARACDPAAQTVTFERKFYLPGPPKNFEAMMGATKSYAIQKARVYINGAFAFQIAPVGGGSPYIVVAKTEDRYPRMFKNGSNLIRVEVTKFADTASNRICRGTPLGFAFEFRGEFAADLQSSRNPGQHTRVERIAHNNAATFRITDLPFLKNNGPSAAYQATFRTMTGGAGYQVQSIELVPLDASIDGCALSTNKVSMQCPILKWAPGTVKRFPAGVEVKLRAVTGTPSTSYVNVTVNVSSPTLDPNMSNNGTSLYIYICRPASTNAECQQ